MPSSFTVTREGYINCYNGGVYNTVHYAGDFCFFLELYFAILFSDIQGVWAKFDNGLCLLYFLELVNS